MKNSNLIFLALALLILALGCKKDSEKEPDTEKTPSNEISISVTLPDGWTKVENSVLEHQYTKHTASFMIKNEYVLNRKDIDVAVNEAKTQIGDYFESASFSETQNITIDGKDARSITFTYSGTAAGMTLHMKSQHVYVMVNEKCYLIVFGDMESSYDVLANDYQFILNGIKFEIKK